MMTVATVSLDSSGNFWDQRDSSWMSGVRTSRSWSVWEAAEEKKHGAMQNVLTNSNSTCLPAGSKLTIALSKNTNPPALQISRYYTILYNHNVITQLFANNLPDSKAKYLPKILKELDCLTWLPPLQQTRSFSQAVKWLSIFACLSRLPQVVKCQTPRDWRLSGWELFPRRG